MILFGVDYGLGVGFILNLIATVVRASRCVHRKSIPKQIISVSYGNFELDNLGKS